MYMYIYIYIHILARNKQEASALNRGAPRTGAPRIRERTPPELRGEFLRSESGVI